MVVGFGAPRQRQGSQASQPNEVGTLAAYSHASTQRNIGEEEGASKTSYQRSKRAHKHP
jgi:hypothetical protein